MTNSGSTNRFFNRLNAFINNHRYELMFGAILIIYVFNMFLDIMEIDAAQYANISMEMSYNRSFLEVYFRGHDYLDKPPLLFWMSSVSFILFGISNFTYKLPSVLIAILGIYSTYRFTRMWYDKKTGILAALILASTQAFFLLTNDIRTDTSLVGLVIFSVWQMSLYIRENKWKHLVLGAVGTGGAMLAKGPIGLVIPAVAIGADLLLKRDWKNMFRYQWLIFLLIVAVVLLPMSYGLFVQFDLHPEKIVYKLQGPSGLKFFYWTQSFGRITGDIYWKNDTSFFFFFHSILWDMQPWIMFFIPALFISLFHLVKKRFRLEKSEEAITLAGFVIMLLALSMSNFKLPHYIFPIFPFAAVITATFIIGLKEKIRVGLGSVVLGLIQLYWLLIIIMFIFIFPVENILIPVIAGLLLFLSWYFYDAIKTGTDKVVIPILITAIGFNFVMATHFYPNLLEFQASAKAGKMVDASNIPPDGFYFYRHWENVLDFYSRRTVLPVEKDKLTGLPEGTWIFTHDVGYKDIIENNLPFKKVAEFDYHGVTTLRLNFLNRSTRSSTLKKYYIMEKI
ncbi:MAG: glycosyltransferase family 39 protein [Bacteroidales bacterium]|nr:glycosyltransferase family 39 protein [Bacteroidales bacterium]